MVRTVATAFRASGGKSSKAAKTSSTPRANTSSSSDRNTIGGNTVCPRETPTWQKPITNFFTKHVERPEANISEKFEELNIEKTTTNVEFLGEGCSTSNNIENNCDGFLNKEKSNSRLQGIHGRKNEAQIESNENTDEDKNKIPAKKQKLDFYKHLENIEQI